MAEAPAAWQAERAPVGRPAWAVAEPVAVGPVVGPEGQALAACLTAGRAARRRAGQGPAAARCAPRGRAATCRPNARSVRPIAPVRSLALRRRVSVNVPWAAREAPAGPAGRRRGAPAAARRSATREPCAASRLIAPVRWVATPRLCARIPRVFATVPWAARSTPAASVVGPEARAVAPRAATAIPPAKTPLRAAPALPCA
jgi:hypothetical protein